MATKYYAIEAVSPTYAEPGQKGARNVNNLEKIFPRPFGNNVGTNDGKQEGNFKSSEDGKKSSADDVDTSKDNAYQNWYINHVVNGVVESKWLIDSAGGSSEFSMNYKNAPSLMLDEKPLKTADGDIAGTNQFVPVLVTQADSKTGALSPGKVSEDNVKIAAQNFMKKTSVGAGVGPNAGSEGRNPAATSAKQKASNSKTLTLGSFLSQPKK